MYLIALAVLAMSPAREPEARLPADGQRVLFLGDSNTFAGGFIARFDAYLMTRHPERKVELINLGLPSETCSGLSEADHPYPRPDVHTRLDAALAKTKPNIVVACYGMNDGIYSPFDEGRFKKYQEGYAALIAKCEKAGATVILMTPAPFDALPLKNRVLPAGEPKYSWVKPYAKYDSEVLTKYSEWLVGWRKKGYLVADAHSALLNHLEEKRKTNPEYRVSGDGIHPDGNGHEVIFRELLKTFGGSTEDWKLPEAKLWKLIEQRQQMLGLAWLTDVGHKRPDTPKGIPLEEATKKAVELEKEIRAMVKQASVKP
ncbi:SGNH/GDSL hydrolase family protein [Zavarzinella formosa]|uniref:SGNH/GDSL hydrolase family protein n=1 Tax=Zavarzinella formosa TaxID=360055 RepID=UPI0003117952|nr:SGNH/GDSL hydrolase family protein [Zavarzinella formosa]